VISINISADSFVCLLIFSMPARRLDDRIRELSAKVAEASKSGDTGSEEVEETLRELKAALREKIDRLRSLAARKLVYKDGSLTDRRESRP
jgi:hypothetical protein